MRVEITAGGILKIMADDSEDSLRMRMWLVENKNLTGTENMLFDTCPAMSDRPSDSQAEVSDSEMLDYLFKNNPLMPNGREAIRAAMRAEREGS